MLQMLLILTSVTIKNLKKKKYSEKPKTSLVRPIFKKIERNKRDKKLQAGKYSK